jgi:isopentenyl phosphate kinase
VKDYDGIVEEIGKNEREEKVRLVKGGGFLEHVTARMRDLRGLERSKHSDTRACASGE